MYYLLSIIITNYLLLSVLYIIDKTKINYEEINFFFFF